MDEKGNKLKMDVDSEKLEWEIPVLVSLDKGKTEGGTGTTYEDFYAYPGS